MDGSFALLAFLAQGDGLSLNTFTLGIITAIVLGLVGAITFLFKYASSNQDKYIDRLITEKAALEAENRELMEALIGALRTGNRAADAADEAARELLKRRTRKPT